MSYRKARTKDQMTIPTRLRQRAGLNVGDLLEAKLEKNGKITLTRQTLLERHIEESLEDIRAEGQSSKVAICDLKLRRFQIGTSLKRLYEIASKEVIHTNEKSLALIAALLFLSAGCNLGRDLAQQQYQCAQIGEQLQQQDAKDNGGSGVIDVAYHYNTKLNKCLYQATLVFPNDSSDHQVRDAYENKVLVHCHFVGSPNPTALCLNNMDTVNPTLDVNKAQDLMTNLMSQ